MIKKYKLIKSYPGCSAKLHEIVNIENNIETGYYSENPEFWEEIIEKDYEIIAYINIGSKHVWKQNSQLKHVFHVSSNKRFAIGLTDILELPDIYKIHSIKRLSDNVIFNVGDTVQLNDMWDYNCKIKEINIYNNEVAFNIQDKVASASYRKFEKFKKVKPVLFTTEDGVDIFEGDYYVAVFDNFNYLKQEVIKNYELDNAFLRFSTKEKADEYILYNKPCLSLKDVQECMNETNINLDDEHMINFLLKEEVKSKL